MIFKDLPLGAAVFLDANIFLYHFTADATYGAACTELIERIERDELTAFTATHILGEVAHRMMTIEISLRCSRPFAGIVRWMEQHPSEVQQLTRFRQALQEVPRYHIQVLAIRPGWLGAAAAITQQTGLLHNDSLVAATMQAQGLTNLASADTDFDRVPGITRYAPL